MSVSESLDNVIESEPASAEELSQTLVDVKKFFDDHKSDEEQQTSEGKFYSASRGTHEDADFIVVWNFLEPEKAGGQQWRIWVDKTKSGLSFYEDEDGKNPKAVFNSASAGDEVKRGDIGQPAITQADLDSIRTSVQE